MTSGYIEIAVSEVHAARNAMRDALIALYGAVQSGEAVDPVFRRLIHSEIVGAREEATVLAALLANSASDAAS